MTGPRDWDKELAEIDRMMAKGGNAPPEDRPAAASPARPTAPTLPPAPAAPVRQGPVASPAPRAASPAVGGLRTWLVTLLGPMGAACLAIWPYAKACGPMLGVYLVGVLAVFGAGIWAMRWAWLARRGLALVVGTLTLVASLVLAAAEILPRTGYAAVTAGWVCSP